MKKCEPGKKYMTLFLSNILEIESLLNISDTKLLELIESPISDNDSELITLTKNIYNKSLLAVTKETLHKLASDELLKEYLSLILELIETRYKNNLSQNDLSYNLKIPELSIRRIENLQVIPSFTTLFKICRELKVNLNFTF